MRAATTTGISVMSDDGQLQTESSVRFERVLPGPIERIWDFITGSEQLSGWLGGECAIEPRAGGAVSLSGSHIRGVVTQWRPPRVLAYTWNVFAPGATESSLPESYLTIALQPYGGDVRLALVHRPIVEGFEGLSLMGWHTLLDMLDALVRNETPPAREAIMERNRARYGVEQATLERARAARGDG